MALGWELSLQLKWKLRDRIMIWFIFMIIVHPKYNPLMQTISLDPNSNHNT